MKVLVTGHNGFIGSSFVRNMPEDWELTGYDWSIDKANDINDTQRLAKKLQGHDAIVNFAGEINMSTSNLDPVRYWRNNTLGFVSVLRAARACDVPVVHASTGQVFQFVDNHYLASKYAAEVAANAEREYSNLPIMKVRILNPYGPKQPDNFVIPLFIKMAKAGEPVTLNNGGSALKDFIHVNDVGKGFVAAVKELLDDETPRHTVLLGTTRLTRIKALAGMVYTLVGSYMNMVEVQNRRIDGNSPQISKEDWPKDWSPIVTLENGIRSLL